MPLKNNTALGNDAITSPGGQLATPGNFIDPYTYAQQYEPDKHKKAYLKRGSGSLMKFCSYFGQESSFASDQVLHAELGELHENFENVTVVGSTFTFTEAHNLRPGEIIIISDGTIEKHATVDSITSPTVIEALNNEGGAFGFTGTVSLFPYSNSFAKGTGGFTIGKQWKSETIYNYPQIIKEYYSINESDMAHLQWFETPQFKGGEAWYNMEMQRTLDLYENEIEMTHLLGRRLSADSAAAIDGKPRGMKGYVQQVEERGNIGNEYVKTKADLQAIAFRLKQQGGVTVATVWGDHQQGIYFSDIAADANGAYATGQNYGLFDNDKEMAINLDFTSIKVAGVTFHFAPLNILDNPKLLGTSKFKDSSIACIIMPAGQKKIMSGGETFDASYFNLKYRRLKGINRYKKTKIFGGDIGTPIDEDEMRVTYTTEQTSQLVGANEHFVIRKGTGIYTGS
ncbi:hypothetical protein [Wenyingzhuangia sp. 2_MG-2023]|uniref:hypothetical protein n=1 Tax=Wenyingzhuangia sp. 2_MG-2023 TaxID=3062639 RepID=UPI0026E11734|nr:hypothetical protein [Wenyingzhuangia sp. 2_MG-2023]MDO6737096.1 hypothetical protein [Wenyingzhuangia sp. 2_MG-2023]